MGCDIHCYAERKVGNNFQMVGCNAFDYRSYGVFGFLAGVRNYSEIPPISAPRGIPPDASPGVRNLYNHWRIDAHSTSWLSVSELSAFDYDQPIEDRRVTVATEWGYDGGRTAKVGGGEITTYREFLCDQFFNDIKKLQDAGADRIVFWFDN